MEEETGNALVRPPMRFAAPSARQLAVRRRPRSRACCANVRTVAIRSAKATSENAAAGSSRSRKSLRSDVRHAEGGQAAVDLADDRDPVSSRGRRAAAMTSASASTTRDGGTAGRKRLTASATASKPALRITVGPFASPSFETTSQMIGEEVARADVDPQELAELGRDHDQRDAVDVAEQHRLAEEVGDEPQPQNPGQEEQARPSRAPAPRRARRSAPGRLRLRPSPAAPPSPRSARRASSRGRSRAGGTSRATRRPRAAGRSRRARRRPAGRRARPSPATRAPPPRRPSLPPRGRTAETSAGSATASPVPAPPRPSDAARALAHGTERLPASRRSSRFERGICHGRPAPGPTGATRPAARSSRGHSWSHAPSMTMTSRTNLCLIP